ncbi:MAG: excalibur calcium-binding domain-containing protein [Actinomycetota bacterium]|nr:excalibur calcium-binding domain-containing protein [Actinomycetota bacterium]
MSLRDRLPTGSVAARTVTFPTAPLPPSYPLRSLRATVTEPRSRFVGLAWASLILGIVGVMLSAVPILNALTMLGAIVGLVLGGIALFGSRKRLAAIGTVACVLAVVFTVSSSATAPNQSVGPVPSLDAPRAPVEPPAPQVAPAPPTPISETTGARQAIPTAPAERVATPDQPDTVRLQPAASGPVASQPVMPRPAAPPQPVAPQPVIPQPVTPQPDNDSSGHGAYYQNCTAVRAAGAAPIRRGEPGYRSELDRDDDGIACEK